MDQNLIVNAQLEGNPFYWEGGPVGILLIHGFTATTIEIQPLGQVLRAKGYTVSGPLLPGHFSRPEDLNSLEWQDWFNAVDEAYQKLASHCKQVFVGGESLGGLLALLLASTYPEITGVLAYAPALHLNMTIPEKLSIHLLAPFKSYLPKQPGADENLPWQGYIVNPLKGLIQLFKLQDVVEKRLSIITQPVLIVQGRRDARVDPYTPNFIFNEINSEVKEIHWMENSTHVVILDKDFDQVTEITLSFLDRVLSVTKH